jgi:hypothetical protein
MLIKLLITKYVLPIIAILIYLPLIIHLVGPLIGGFLVLFTCMLAFYGHADYKLAKKNNDPRHLM